MCFNNDQPEAPKPARPPEVLQQAAPDKKTAAQPSQSNTLAIGTKKYRRDTGLGPTGSPKAPTGISL